MARLMNLVLNVWRQKSAKDQGAFVRYEAKAINDHMSFLEMLDVVNEELAHKGEEPIAFDHDCREGICGACSLMINGRPHGGQRATTTCQLHMRKYNDGDEIYIEPWRANAFPVIKDLCVDRTAFDVRPSLELSVKNKLDLRLGADYGFSSRTHAFGAYVQIGKKI